MKPWMRLAVGMLVVLITGCTVTGPALEERTALEARAAALEARAALNAWLVNTFEDAAIDNAIIVQYTLFPYHFVNNAAALNELGRHDLDVLAAHYKGHPGPLNVRQGGVPAELYEARVREVTWQLVMAGVDRDRITVADGLPGGDGMESERVLMIGAGEGN